MLHIVTWLWGNKYGQEYVHRLKIGVAHHIRQPYNFIVAAPQREDQYLTTVPGCFARLRMFDYGWQKYHGISGNERIVCMDLDSIVTDTLDPLFERKETFVILQGANTVNPCPYNGSLMMLRAGHYHYVWESFSLERAARIKQYEFPDDQGWLWETIPDAAGWPAGSESGVYAFKKHGWPSGDALPQDARLVVFPGWRDPKKFAHLPWVQHHWVRLVWREMLHGTGTHNGA